MTKKFEPKVNCRFSTCIQENCPLYVNLPENIVGKPVHETTGDDQDGFVWSVYHTEDTTLINGFSQPEKPGDTCRYILITKGPKEEEIIDKIRKRIGSWKPVELTE